MRVTKTTLKKLIKEELDVMQGESNPFGSYKLQSMQWRFFCLSTYKLKSKAAFLLTKNV